MIEYHQGFVSALTTRHGKEQFL
ncbi:hypothetical protein SBA2_450091 [Acidobacteriia bacterium SbA2]|nr:hypothetical protein SBA2_450091 [Acidobacteriia bacterium SbA2]